jgi:hypothetical protein
VVRAAQVLKLGIPGEFTADHLYVFMRDAIFKVLYPKTVNANRQRNSEDKNIYANARKKQTVPLPSSKDSKQDVQVVF